VGWTTGEIFGLALGQALLSLALSDGQITLSDTIVPAGNGEIRLEGLVVDLRATEPVLGIPGRLHVLKNVDINPKVARQLLSRINPIFTNMANMEGKISLLLENMTLPLSRHIKQTGTGRGHVDLSQIRVQPSGLLAELLQLGGLVSQGTQSMKVSSLDFAIKDGRINYDNFVVMLADDFVLKFYESIGFDDTLDLVVSIPIRAALLQRFGVRGPVVDYVRLLKGASVDVPITGTRLEPKLDFVQVNIQPLIERALEDLLKEKAQKVLEDIFKPKKTEKPGALPDKPWKTPESKPSERDVLDILFDVIEQQNKSSKKDETHQ